MWGAAPARSCSGRVACAVASADDHWDAVCAACRDPPSWKDAPLEPWGRGNQRERGFPKSISSGYSTSLGPYWPKVDKKLQKTKQRLQERDRNAPPREAFCLGLAQSLRGLCKSQFSRFSGQRGHFSPKVEFMGRFVLVRINRNPRIPSAVRTQAGTRRREVVVVLAVRADGARGEDR